MKRIITILYLITYTLSTLMASGHTPAAAAAERTDAHLAGHVIDAATGEHMPYVTVQVKGTNIGTVTDATGHYRIMDMPAGEVTVVASMMGYEPQELTVVMETGKTTELNITLSEASYMMDNVVVTASKYETRQREAASIVNVVTPLTFETTASNTMSEVLDFQTGLRVEQSCQNCGAPQLRINGLGGEYSQILMDSRPIFSSLAAVYGLEQIPAGMVDRIEVMRGGGSAMYGANAIGGVVNIITKEPKSNSLTLSNSTNLIGGRSFDVNTTLNGSFVTPDSKIGVFLFGVIRERQAYDRDGDGFSEIPLIKGSTVGFRSFFKTSAYSKITAEYHHVGEKRRGGNNLDLPEHEADIAEATEHNIDAGSLKFDYFTPDNAHMFSVYASTQHIARDSYYGAGRDPNAYGKSDDLTVVAGAQYRYSMNHFLFLPADLSAGVEYSYNTLRDQILGYGRDIRQQVHLYGGYLQNEWKNEMWSILIGARLEKHNLLKNPVCSPRASLRYTPIEEIVLRASYAMGYRAPQIYEEDLHVGATGGDVSLIELDPSLRQETSHSASLSADFAKRFGRWETGLTLEGFFTQLNDVFSLVDKGFDAQGNRIFLRTNASGARIAGLNVEAKVAYTTIFSLQLGYTWQQSRYIDPFQWSETVAPQRRMFRAPDHYGYFTAQVEPLRRFTISLSGKYTGRMLVQHLAGYIPEDTEVLTPDFFDLGLKLAYDIPLYQVYTLEINAGVKNIFDAYQRDFDRGVNRDASYIYGPAIPRTFFAGLALRL